MAIEHPIEWDDDKVSRLWSYYTRTGVPYFSDLHGAAILKESRLPLAEPLDILDLGCGPGFIFEHLRRLGSRWRYTGADFSEASVEAARSRAAGHPNFSQALSVRQLPTPLPDSAFDVVMLIEVVEHLDEAKLMSTLTEAARLLRQGGVLIISTPNDEDLSKQIKLCPECGALFHEWQHVRKWTAASLAQCVADYGFRPREVRALDFGTARLTGWLASTARGLLKGGCKRPHMLATFSRT